MHQLKRHAATDVVGFSADLVDFEGVMTNNPEVSPAMTAEERPTRFVCSAPKCTDGEHVMDGPVVQVGRAYSVSCSKCGVSAFEVDMFMGGF